MKRFVIAFIVFAVLTGCAKPGKVEFVEVVRTHKELTAETNSALVASIEDDLRSRPNLSAEEKKAVQNLIDRLKFISRQSEVIYEYIMETEVNNELMAKLISHRWNLGKQK